MLAVMGRKPKARAHPEKPAHPLLLWRERYGVSQREVMDACGISQATLSKIENGYRGPRGDKLESLRAYTGLPTDAFIRPYQLLLEDPTFLEQSHGPQVSD
jgi:transcriptional regulator with XRE-family HTH domain